MSDGVLSAMGERGINAEAEVRRLQAELRDINAALAERDQARAEVERLQGRVTAGDKAVEVLTQGLATAEVELMRIRADLRLAAEDRERLRAANDRLAAERDRRADAERDRLRAVLAECPGIHATMPEGTPIDLHCPACESETAALRSRAEMEPTPPLCGSEADDAAHYAYRKEGAAEERLAVLAWLRGRAGNNPSPVSLAAAIERGEHRRRDLEAADVNHGQQDDSANAQPAGVAVAPSGQAGGGQSASAGLPAGQPQVVGPIHCRLCGALGAWIWDLHTGQWFGECLLGQGCRVGPNVGAPPAPLSIPPGTPTSAMLVMGPAARELLRVPGGVTPAELLKAGFPDVAARLAGGDTPVADPAPGRRYCTGAEFVAAAQAVIEPRTDEEIAEILADVGVAPPTPVRAHIEVGPAGPRLTCERCGLVFCDCGGG